MDLPGDLIDDLQLHDQLSFLNEGANLRSKNGIYFYSDIIGDLCCHPERCCRRWKDLCLLPSSSPDTPSSAAGIPVFSRQNSARFSPVSPSSWSAASPFSCSSIVPCDDGSPEDYSPMVLPGDLIDDLQLHDQLSFLNEGANLRSKNGIFFYSDIIGDLCCHPSAAADEDMSQESRMNFPDTPKELLKTIQNTGINLPYDGRGHNECSDGRRDR
ncbi:Zinc finger CCCH domain-containing protein 53 [Platanthera guangdongensis]|uniref:Zinc finger CCCH domain-containing protein 53 n=1 Tax=Platanthera guangdongensis TaxID=2320717 RepID=A0ABR2MWV6_9ASPA